MAQLEEVKGRISFDANTSGIDKAKSSLSGLQQSTVDASKKFAVGVAAMGAAVIGFLGKSVQLADAYENNKLAFDVMLGSGEKAQVFLEELRAFAAKTPFEFNELQNSAKQLMAMGFAAEEVIPNMTALGNMAAVTGKEKLPLISLALGQMHAKTYLAGGEIKQFVENGVPLIEMLAERYGVTAEEVYKMSEAHEISAADVEDSFQKMYGASGKFGGLMDKQSKTISGLISTLKDTITGYMIDIGNAVISKLDLKGKLSGVVDFITRFADSVGENGLKGAIAGLVDSPAWSGFINFLSNNSSTVIAVIAGAILGALVPAIWAFAAGVWAALAPLLPFIAVGALVAAGIALLVKWWQGGSDSANFFHGVMQKIHDYFVNNIMPILQVVWGFIKEHFIKAWNDLRAAIEPHLPMLKQVAKVIGIVLLVAIGLIIAVIAICVLGWIAMVLVIMKVVTWVMKLITWFKTLAINVQIFVGNMIMGVVEWFRGLPGRVMGAISGLGERIGQVFQAAKDWVRDILNGILQYFRELPGKIMSLVSGLGSRIGSAIGNIPIIGKLAGNAQGTDNWRGGMTLVGEEGPEIVSLPKGSRIYSNGESQKMMAGGSGVTVNMNVQTNGMYDWRAIAERVGYKVAMAR